MATITDVVVHQVHSPLVRPFVTAVRRADAIEVMLVELRDSDGRRGWGEAACSWRVTGESSESVRAVVEQLIAPQVVGRPVADWVETSAVIAGAVFGNAAARSAVECAALDLVAQGEGVPLAQWLAATHIVPGSGQSQNIGGAQGLGEVATSVRTDMTLSAGPAAEVLAAAHEQAGTFATLKVKAADPLELVEALRAIRADFPTIALRIDANQAWDAMTAIETLQQLHDEQLGVELAEQPVPALDWRGLVEVAAASPIPVLADETVRTRHELEHLLRLGGVPMVNIKLAKTGGLVEALELAALARENGVDCLVGGMMEAHVGVGCAAALAAAINPSATHDLDAALWQRGRPVVGGIEYSGDQVLLSDQPGLGITGTTPIANNA